MKQFRLVATLTIIATLILTQLTSCKRGTQDMSENASDSSQSSQANMPPGDTIAPTSTPINEGGVDLIEASSRGYVDYTLSGLGTSGEMNIKVTNKTDQPWDILVGVGTKLQPQGGNVQSMVVTKDTKVHVAPHEKKEAKLTAACLDISKAPPGKKDASWNIEKSPELAGFISCTNNFVDEMKRMDSGNSELFENMRPTLIQFAVWEARGASREDWIDFWVNYQGKAEDEARELITELEPVLEEIVRRCPTLPKA